MARHKLSDAEKLRGAERALANRKTPQQFLPGLRRLRDRLRKKLLR